MIHSLLRKVTGCLALGLGAAACHPDANLPSGPAGQPQFSLGEEGGQPKAIRPDEQLFADLAKQAPSSAGFFVTPRGQLRVNVRDPIDDEKAASAAATLVATGAVQDSRLVPSEIAVERVRFTFRELAVWRDAIFDQIFGTIPDLRSLDLNEATNSIMLGVSRGTATSVARTLFPRLASLGVDTTAVVFREHGPIDDGSLLRRGRFGSFLLPSTLNGTADTLVGGLEIQGAAGTCSLGVIVDYTDNLQRRGLVTAAHCSANEWANDGSNVYQPAQPRLVGVEYVDPPGWGCGFLGTNTCRNSDAAFFSVNSIPSQRGLIARTTFASGPGAGNGSLTIDQSHPYFIITAVDQGGLLTGQYVQKMGRTAGWTWGTVQNTCVDHQNGNWPGQKVTKCAYEANYTAPGGDSGGPVFVFPGGGPGAVGETVVTLAGIHFGLLSGGGNAVFSKWTGVATDLVGPLVATRPTSLGQPSITGGISQGHPSLNWPGVGGATTYEVYKDVVTGAGTSTQLAASQVANAYSDQVAVFGFYGATQPAPPSTAVRYYAFARSNSEISAQSNSAWFSTSPITALIAGPSSVYPGTRVWAGAPWGGAVPYSYRWLKNGQQVGTTQSLTLNVAGASFELRLEVTDALGALSVSTRWITVTPCPPPQLFC